MNPSKLELHKRSISEEDVQVIQSCKRLESLDLKLCTEVETETLVSLIDGLKTQLKSFGYTSEPSSKAFSDAW
jgi:hypothetical protein